MVAGVVVFSIGVIVQACTTGGHYSYILGGRFVTGLGVGTLSMVVPLYNAELAGAGKLRLELSRPSRWDSC